MRLLVLLLLVAALGDALRVEDGGVSQLAGTELSEHARVVRTWTAFGTDRGDEPRLLAIHSGVKCQVYVSFAPSVGYDGEVATVRVIGDSELVVQSFVAVTSSGTGQIDLSEPAHTPGVELDGYVRVEIVTHAMSALREVVVSSDGAVVVSEQLLASDSAANVLLKTTDSGDLYVKSQLSVNANRLEIQASGSGSIYFSAGSIAWTTVDVSVSGSGDVRMDVNSLRTYTTFGIQTTNSGSCYFKASSVVVESTDLKTTGPGAVKLDVSQLRTYSSLTLTTTSSGSVSLQAQEISSSLSTFRNQGSAAMKVRANSFHSDSAVSVDVTSSGEVYVSLTDLLTSHLTVAASSSGEVSIDGGPSSISQCDLALSGSGVANLGNVICRDADVTSSGSAEVTVQVTESLTYGTSSRSELYYVGQAPRSMASSCTKSKSPKSCPAKERMTLSMPTWSTSYVVPARKLYHVLVGDSYSLVWDLDDDNSDENKSSVPKETTAESKTTNWRVILFGGLVVLFIVLWGRVEKAWRKRRQRLNEKFPLLGQEAPVYI